VGGILDELIRKSPELQWACIVIMVCLPVEMLLGTGHKVSWAERAGNLGAMLVNFVAGVALVSLVLRPSFSERLLDYPDTPRWAVLGNPVLYAVVVLFLVDGLYYVYHRLQHTVPLLWHIHKLHHTDPAVNITTARRTHFLERPIQLIFLVVPVLWLLGGNDDGFVWMAILGPGFLYFTHLDARVPLGPLTAVVVGPQYHRIHHACIADTEHANFAQAFPLFDILGGTYQRPAHGEYPTTGVAGCDTAASRWRPLLW
jgi:sterol desaturase/sphingolipid hydroxylase (fatty acid hydroxylase superfamily)